MILGIDPGLYGAYAVMDENNTIVLVESIPVLTVSKGQKTRREYNLHLIVKFLQSWNDRIKEAAVEVGHPRPGEGVVAAYSIGRGTMVWEAMLTALKISYTKCYPNVWKKKMLGAAAKDKNASIMRAAQLFPAVAAEHLVNKSDHNKAEAMLLAYYLKNVIWR